MDSLLLWLPLTILCILVQSFYSMLEMALVSFNRIRLHYYINQGSRRAKWIQSLLKRPSHLFGTTLLGVNIALQIGSECSREVYTALNLDPDIAPLTQVFLVLIFAELSPMFAARRYAEPVAMLGIPIIALSSWVMRPLIWIIGLISGAANWLVGGRRGQSWSLLSREELQHMVTEPSEKLDNLVRNIFDLREKVARDVMLPMHGVHSLPSKATVAEMRNLLRRFAIPCVPIYDRSWRNVVAIAYPRDLVRTSNDTTLRDCARSAWFITQKTPLMEVLTQFRHNNETVAIVLDYEGRAIGLLTLEDLLEEIFGKQLIFGLRSRAIIERTLPANMRLRDFNVELGTSLQGEKDETLAQLITKMLGHPPEKGENIRIENVNFTVVETSLLGAKTVIAKATR